MAKRMLLMLAVAGLVITALGWVKFRQVKAEIAAHSSFQPPPEAVTTVLARQEQWPATLSAIGTVDAVRGVLVSADLPGIVEKIGFESGMAVKEGDVLLQLDTRQEQAQLAAAEAQKEVTRLNFARMQQLQKEGVISRMDFDNAEAQYKQADANAEEIRATIGRKTIRAPFSGVLGIRQVNLGQYLAGGAAIVQLQSLDPVYVNFSVPQEALGHLRIGQEVHARTDSDLSSQFSGRLTAINSVVDEATRNIELQATLPNPANKLRPGMFVQSELALGGSQTVITLPASAINYAPYGDSVFVVTNMKTPKGDAYRGVAQRFVKLGGTRGDQVAILSGLNPGDEVVSSGVFKLRNGAAVQVNNTIQPSDSPSPKVEDR